MPLIDAYKDLITSQHRGQPKYMAALTALLSHSEGIFELGIYVDDEFDIDEANGAQLDVLGEIVGAKRNLHWQPYTQATARLDDETYRIYLKAKIAQNLWKGGIEDLEEIWVNLFGERIRIQDNQDMTIMVIMDNPPSNILREMISHNMIVPKPQSVRVNHNFIVKTETTQYYFCLPTRHAHYFVAAKKPHPGDLTAKFYLGNSTAIHKKQIVAAKKPTAATVQIQPYKGAATTYHRKYIL